MWQKELGDNYRSKEKIVFTNKGTHFNRNFRTSFINLSLFDDNLNNIAAIEGRNYTYSSNDVNLKRSWNLGRILEHEVLAHSVMRLEDYTIDYFGKKEFNSGKMTALKLVNIFRVEIGLQDYQRLTYCVQGQPLILFGNPTKSNLFGVSYFK